MTMENKNTIVLYHDHCPDGFTSAWAAYKKFGDSASYVPASYHVADTPDVTGKDVYILDFSYPLDTLLSMAKVANSVYQLDHHKSARDTFEKQEDDRPEKNLPDNLKVYFDMARSGAGISWDFFHEGERRPLLVDYVEDRDLWLFNLKKSKEVNSVITSHEFSFSNWEDLDRKLTHSKKAVWAEGSAILRSKDTYVRTMKGKAESITFLGHISIPIVNAPHINISELVGSLSEDALFAVGWSYVRGQFMYSLRSRGDFDVSDLAKSMGGGGHKGAAGFNSAIGPWDLEPRGEDIV